MSYANKEVYYYYYYYYYLKNVLVIPEKHCLQLNNSKSRTMVFGPKNSRDKFESIFKNPIKLNFLPIFFSTKKQEI